MGRAFCFPPHRQLPQRGLPACALPTLAGFWHNAGMEESTLLRPWEELERLARAGGPEEVRAFLAPLSPGDAANAVLRMPLESQLLLVSRLRPHDAVAILTNLPSVQSATILNLVPAEKAAELLNEIPSDERADLLASLDADRAGAILQLMEPEKTREFLSLAKYPPDVAGGLMAKEFVAYPEHLTIGDVVRDLRANADKYRDYQVQYVYIVRPPRILVGVLRLRDLLLARPDQPVRSIMVKPPLALRDHASLEGLEEFFERHNFVGGPVVDAAGRLVGVVQRDAIAEALANRGESDYRKSQGIVGGEELRTMPLLVRSRRRLSWLGANILLNILAASVIAFYQETIATVVALAVFLPIVSDMSGNSGFQAIAVTMREMALGVLRPNEVWRVVSKEAALAVINGAVLGSLVAAAAWIWKGNPYLGLVVGVALAVNTVVAACIGGIMPLLLKRIKLDPALASGPILTTITDMCGFFLVLSFAAAILPWLTQ